ncbi:hypothetical protein EVAR_63656_1 [Eumeta japonica]|uniref:Uncharacterized protein n=1 Tax=Eumeta variegata TaxID=151549 RepID=A0A4C2AFA9_EUMVA|nr:hypothetical protein EVAR_63656_1 [Eumeta japonica]
MSKKGKLVLLVKTGANSSIVKKEAMNVFPGESIPKAKMLKGVSTTLDVVKLDVVPHYMRHMSVKLIISERHALVKCSDSSPVFQENRAIVHRKEISPQVYMGDTLVNVEKRVEEVLSLRKRGIG